MAEQMVLKLPGGMALAVPDGETPTSVYWRHCGLSLTEGICPHHQTPLQPIPCRTEGIGAHCKECRRYWHYEPGDPPTVEWDIDHDPFTWCPEAPAWVR